MQHIMVFMMFEVRDATTACCHMYLCEANIFTILLPRSSIVQTIIRVQTPKSHFPAIIGIAVGAPGEEAWFMGRVLKRKTKRASQSI
jgi:hypothetical protein